MRVFTERKSFMVPAEQKARLKSRAAAEGISLSELVRRATSDDNLRTLEAMPR